VEVSQLQTIEVVVLLGTLAQVAGTRTGRRIVVAGIVVGVSTEVEIVDQAVQRTEVVKHKAVGKLPQAANTVLGKMSHNPHLVKCHNWH
jgi:hypothetical protein